MFVCALVALAFVWESGSSDGRIRGRAYIIDGDSLAVSGVEIRLAGIDAPELSQSCTLGGRQWPCGRAARDALMRETAGREIRCAPVGQDRYGRVIAVCRAGSRDIGARQVASGWALSAGRYWFREKLARFAGRGIWSGGFVAPREWRRDRLPGEGRR